MNQPYIIQGGISFNEETKPQILLTKLFNLYPTIELIVDSVGDYGYDEKNGAFKNYATSYDISNCSKNIKIKTVEKDSCGILSFETLHKDCQKFVEGDRVRIKLDGRCAFCGYIFTRSATDENTMSFIVFDFLRYFKSPLTYMKSQLMDTSNKLGLSIGGYFSKVCSDLKLPFKIIENSNIPLTTRTFDIKTAFNIMDYAINQTLINSPEGRKEYYTVYHEPFIEDDKNDEQLKKTGGNLVLRLKSKLTTDLIIGDESLLKDYNYSSTIDSQTFTRVIVYKDNKTFLSKKGKTLKTGKKTGTRTIISYPDINNLKEQETKNAIKNEGKWGFLPYYYKAEDNYTSAQMKMVAKQMHSLFNRPTENITLNCYGAIGMRAGYLVPIAIKEIGGKSIGKWDTDEEGNKVLTPVYKTVKQCELIVQHPLEMKLTISSGVMGEYDV